MHSARHILLLDASSREKRNSVRKTNKSPRQNKNPQASRFEHLKMFCKHLLTTNQEKRNLNGDKEVK